MGRDLHHILSLILILFLTLILIFEAWHDAGTYDEVGHITAGYSYLYLHDFRLYPDNPPLIKMLAVLPWLPLVKSVNFPTNAPEYSQSQAIDYWKIGTKFLYQSGNNADQLIFLARLPIVFLTLALGLLISKFASNLYGKRAGLFALFLYVMEPNIRAYGHLVTADLGSTFFLILSLYLLYSNLATLPLFKVSRQIGLAGMIFGLAILSKYSMILFLPIFSLIFLFLLFKHKQALKLFIISYLLFLIIAYTTLWAFSLVTNYNRITFRYDDVGLNKSAREQLGHKFVWKGFHAIPLPYYYTVGLEQMYARNLRGQPSFLFGHVNPSGNWWHYFAVTYLVKTPIPILLFLGLAFVKAITSPLVSPLLKGEGKGEVFRKFLTLIIGLFFFIIVSLSGNLSIGFRFVFPAIVLFLLYASSFASGIGFRGKTLVLFFVACLWLVASNVFSLPYDISYINQIGGGTWDGYKTVSDSSYDWGQDLKRLGSWVKNYAPNQSITLSYFGTADPSYYGINYKPLRFEDLENLKGIVAISVTNLMLGGRYYNDLRGETHYDPSPLHKFFSEQPIARAGTTIFIYQFL